MKVKNMVLCAMFAALLCLCAWIAVPLGDAVVTMQTFGLFLTLGVLGGKRGCAAVLVYLLLGAVGLPVFSGFRGGLGALLGVTGGYILGFAALALVYWMISALLPDKLPVRVCACILGLLVCYGFGTVWFYVLYVKGGNAIGIGAVLLKCVVPYLLPDGIKLVLAVALSEKIKGIHKNFSA